MDKHTLVGLVFDHRYEVQQKIGVGGMADVYRGKDTLLGRPVAIKILHQNFGSDQDFVARFKREAQAAGKLNHPNVVSMYDVGFDQGFHYIVMEYVSGCTLKEYIHHHGAQVTVQEAVKITVAIAEGLEHAHMMGIVHCDVKPHNILITDSGRVKVTDFGIARAINSATTMMYTNSVMGSAHYISPEQASGKSINVSTDIYSLGVVLYELLTGEVPFRGETPVSVALQHVKDRVVAPRIKNAMIPPQLEQVVLMALEKEPGKRFGSISEMIQALRMSLGYRGGTSARPIQHDFTTQVLPPLETEVLEEEEPSEGILAKLGSLPQKYVIGGAVFAFLLAFLWAFLSFGNFWSNSTVDVPNVVGKQLSVATRLLEERHLRVSSSEVTNSDVPAGQVISQSPEPGESVKEQRMVHLVVSKGAGDITIPDLQGMSFDQAREKLKALGLSIGKITYENDPSKDDGVVLSQGLQAGGKASKGATVDITINQTKGTTVEIPNVVGMTIKEAKEALGNLGLSIGKISGSNEDSAVVTAVSPAPGSSVKRDESITLVGQLKDGKKDGSNTKQGDATKGVVDVTVPNGRTSQHVKLVVIDDDGGRVVYDGTNAPGDRIVKSVSGSGNVRVQIYLNNALVQEQSL